MKRFLRALAMLWLIITSVCFLPAQADIRLADSTSSVASDTTERGLQDTVFALEEVQINTGYQILKKANSTGSVEYLNNEALNRSVDGNILERIRNLTPGVSFGNPGDGLLIRGRNSIYSNVSPLIVLDHFPYDGDIESINPDDVASITILKDAAAAALWGARAGNGVIVITTKRGRTSRARVGFNGNLGVKQRPDLFSVPMMSSADFIELEQELFERGYYNNDLRNPVIPPPLTPVVELLAAVREGTIGESDAVRQIEQWKSYDVRHDLTEHFYRRAIRQQYAFNVSGDTGPINYYMSAGLNDNLANLVGERSQRFTLRSQNSFRISRTVDIDVSLQYTSNNSYRGSNNGWVPMMGNKGYYPYADLVGPDGTALPIARDYRLPHVMAKEAPELMDWLYRPYDEIAASENRNTNRSMLVGTGLKWRFRDGFSLDVKYNFQNELLRGNSLQSEGAYSTRFMINRYYQPDAVIKYPVPIGGILGVSVAEVHSHQGRAQLNYDRQWGEVHVVSALAGWEIKDLQRNTNSHQLFGYRPDQSQVYAEMDFVTQYQMYDRPGVIAIGNPQYIGETIDRFISSFANVNYSYRQKYILSGSIREDAANLFGVETNQRGVPLWSVGTSWFLDREEFYRIENVPVLRLRASYGYTGNFSRQAAAVTTIRHRGSNNFGEPWAAIETPPNKELRWEQNRVLNVGVDFGFDFGGMQGSVEYFSKHNVDLMGQAPLDPTLGILSGQQGVFYGNVASMKGNGVEARLSARVALGGVSWSPSGHFTYVATWVTEYLMDPPTRGDSYLNTGSYNPIVGKPIFTMYAYEWGGLDPKNGNPLGYLNGERTDHYTNLVNTTVPEELVYFGPVQAPCYGALTNTFTYRSWSLSFLMNYSFGNTFRRNSVAHTAIAGSWSGHSDFALRWQRPGDELITQIPSYDYAHTPSRDAFFRNTAVLVEDAAYLRLQDVRMDYRIPRSATRLFQDFRIYANMSDIGLLWKASAYHPLRGNVPRPGKQFTFGISATL